MNRHHNNRHQPDSNRPSSRESHSILDTPRNRPPARTMGPLSSHEPIDGHFLWCLSEALPEANHSVCCN